VSAATEALLSDACEWIHCGERSIKGKGMMNTYIARFGQWQHAVLARQRQVSNLLIPRQNLLGTTAWMVTPRDPFSSSASTRARFAQAQ
jgi:hypothetical protein